jgi:hypothetical protein
MGPVDQQVSDFQADPAYRPDHRSAGGLEYVDPSMSSFHTQSIRGKGVSIYPIRPVLLFFTGKKFESLSNPTGRSPDPEQLLRRQLGRKGLPGQLRRRRKHRGNRRTPKNGFFDCVIGHLADFFQPCRLAAEFSQVYSLARRTFWCLTTSMD